MMPKKYEAPQLNLVGDVEKVVMGSGSGGLDAPFETAPDFEFEHDWTSL